MGKSKVGHTWEVRVLWPDRPSREYDELLDSLSRVHNGKWVLSDFGPLMPKRSKRNRPRPYRSCVTGFATKRAATAYARAAMADPKAAELSAGYELSQWQGEQLVTVEKQGRLS